MAQLGRISGPLLEQNLAREGIDLKFSNTTFDSVSLLYLAVSDGRIGVKTDTPVFDLDINGDTKTTNLIVDNLATVGNVKIASSGLFSTVVGPLYLTPTGGGTIMHQRMRSDDLDFNDNTISGLNSNQSIELSTSGTGTVEVPTSTNIYGNLGVTGNILMDGNISAGGNIIVGNELYNPATGQGDTVIINTDLTQDIIPGDDDLFDLGRQQLDSSPRRWDNVYITDNFVNTDTVLPQAITVSDQMNINGVDNEIFALQSNDDIVLAPDTGINIIEWTKWRELTATSTAADINGFVLTIGGTITGQFVPGMLLSGVGIIPGTIITGTSTGSDSAGTYTVNFNYDAAGSRPPPTGTISITGAVDTITNLTDVGGALRVDPETPLTFRGTGIGYLRFMSTNAFIVPTGGNAERPLRPELGDTRWNTDQDFLEVFAGTIQSVTGIANVSGLPNQSQSSLSGTTNGNGINAQFTITIASGALGTITITTVGQGYSAGDLITIPGTAFTGGATPANDLVLTVGAQTNDGYQLSTGGGGEVTVPIMEDLGNVYSLILA